MVVDFKEREIVSRKLELKQQISVLEVLIAQLRSELERQDMRLQVHRKRIAESGVKY